MLRDWALSSSLKAGLQGGGRRVLRVSCLGRLPRSGKMLDDCRVCSANRLSCGPACLLVLPQCQSKNQDKCDAMPRIGLSSSLGNLRPRRRSLSGRLGWDRAFEEKSSFGVVCLRPGADWSMGTREDYQRTEGMKNCMHCWIRVLRVIH